MNTAAINAAFKAIWPAQRQLSPNTRHGLPREFDVTFSFVH
jgi:hypothetical protein